MKVKISASNVNTGKSVKLLEEWKKRIETNELHDVEGEFNKTFDSVGSNIQVLNGSFSMIKPMTCNNGASISRINCAEPSTSSNFKPTVTSTPVVNQYEAKYEDISEAEATEESDGDVTFNFEEDIVSERHSCEKYINEVTQFITKTQSMVKGKLGKRVLLLRKIKKYRKKISKLENAVSDLDRLINFGSKLPGLLENI